MDTGVDTGRYAALLLVERAHRGALESQFTGPLYLARGMGDQVGGRVALVLRGAAANLAVARRAPDLQVGGRTLTSLPDPAADLRALLDRGDEVHVVAGDRDRLALRDDELVPGVRVLDADRLPDLVARAERVWFL